MGDSLKNKLDKLRSENIDEVQKKELLSMFHQNELEYELKVELYQQLDNSDESPVQNNEGFDRLWKKIKNREKGEVKKLRSTHIYWAAAMLVLGFVIGNIFQDDLFQSNEIAYCTAKAPAGSVSEMVLPDGTGISLNAGSELKYATENGEKIREVYLVGEAWFEVEKSDEIPFIVHTPFYDVRVMGTRFNVKAYQDDNEVITTLEEGSVQVESGQNLRIEKNVLLKPGEQLVYHKIDNVLKVNKVDTEVYTSWRNNKLIFINMNLKELIVLLERRYGVDIEVADQSILKYHYDGTIKNETIIEVLNILQATLPINYSINNQKIKIERK